MSVDIRLDGLIDLARYVGSFDGAVDAAASKAVSTAGRFAFAESSREIRGQVNFTQDYIGGAASGGNRLKIQRGMRGKFPFISISARNRPTSLARFVVGSAKAGKPIKVKVKRRGRTGYFDRAFEIRLRSGRTITEDGFNRGIAMRLNKGETIRNKNVDAVPLDRGKNKNVYLLFGPSVAQVFNTVRRDVRPRIERKLVSEFTRQFVLELGRGR